MSNWVRCDVHTVSSLTPGKAYNALRDDSRYIVTDDLGFPTAYNTNIFRPINLKEELSKVKAGDWVYHLVYGWVKVLNISEDRFDTNIYFKH